jgi:hypothetical protein
VTVRGVLIRLAIALIVVVVLAVILSHIPS